MWGEWAYNKNSVYVDEDSATLKVGGPMGNPVLKVTATDESMALTWLQPEWRNWQDLHTAEGFMTLIDKHNKVLKDAKIKQAKGIGKGKNTAA